MWRELILEYTPNCTFSVPVAASAVAELERNLQTELPAELVSLLDESNGVTLSPAFPEFADDPFGLRLIWSAEEILAELTVRELDSQINADGRFSSLKLLLFFASEPNGDLLAFRTESGQVRDTAIVSVSHEDYASQREVFPSLEEYVRQLLKFIASREMSGQ